MPTEVPFAEQLAAGAGEMTVEQKVALAQTVRQQSSEMSQRLDAFLFVENNRLREGLLDARENLEHAGRVLEELSATPWYPAVFLSAVETPHGADGPARQHELLRLRRPLAAGLRTRPARQCHLLRV